MKYFVLFACIAAIANAAGVKVIGNPDSVQILRRDLIVNPDSYNFAYELDNGASAQESGSLKNAETIVAQGSFGFISPEGEQVSLQYVADENGFQPTGAHLPTPPPVPEIILKALEYLRTHASYVELKKKK